jgi:hypothetical protein
MTVGLVLDLLIIVAAFVAIGIGLKKGFGEQFTGFASTVGALVGATFLAIYVSELFLRLNSVFNLTYTFKNIVSGVAGADTVVDSLAELEAVLSSGAMSIFQTSSVKIWEQMRELTLRSMSEYLGYQILKYVLDIVLYIIFYIIISMVFKGLGKLFKSFSDNGFFKYIDKVLGVFWAVGMTYVITAGILLTGVELLFGMYIKDSVDGLMAIINQSIILKGLHTTNVIGVYISDFLGVQLPSLPV